MKPRDQHRHIPPAAELIPRHWTPEQALAAFELLDQLRDLVCNAIAGKSKAACASNSAPMPARPPIRRSDLLCCRTPLRFSISAAHRTKGSTPPKSSVAPSLALDTTRADPISEHPENRASQPKSRGFRKPLTAYPPVNTAGKLNLAPHAAWPCLWRLVLVSSIKVCGEGQPDDDTNTASQT